MVEDIDASAAELTKQHNLKPECAEKLAAGKELEEDDPCWEGYEAVGMKTDENGNEVPNCVPEEEAAALAAGNHILGGTRQLADQIERTEKSGGIVEYEGIKALTEGVWRDQNSGQPIHYMPHNLDVEVGGEINLMHDQSDVSVAGELTDYEHGEDGTGTNALYVDFELNTNTEAGAYADEALQAALESDGEEGFGGPSVEIPAEGQEIEPDGPRGYPYTADGTVTAMAQVGQPAAKTTSYDIQTQERAVALGSGESALFLKEEGSDMSDDRTLAKDMEEAKEMMKQMGYDDPDKSLEDMDDEEMKEMAYEMAELAENMDDGEGEGEGEGPEDDMEMALDEDDVMDMIQEQMDDLWGELDELKEQMDMAASADELSEATDELMAELSEVRDDKEELEEQNKELSERLETLEEQPNNEKRTMAEGNDDPDEWLEADADVSFDANSL